MSMYYGLVLAMGALAVLYGLVASRQVLSASAGNERMQEIAGAVQEGAAAYLRKQYTTIAMVAIAPFVLIGFYDKLCLRLLAPMESRLAASRHLAGDDYSIADVIAYPVAAVSMKRFPGDLAGHPHIARWAAEVGARPAVQRGMKVPR